MALNKEFPRTPPEVRSKYFYGKKLHAWFAASSAALLVGVLAMVIQDYDREWKGYQRQFRVLKEARFEKEYNAEFYAAKKTVEGLKQEVTAAKQALTARETIINAKRKEIASLESKELYDANQQQKFAKAELDTVLFRFEEARKRNAPNRDEAERVWRKWVDTLAGKEEALKAAQAQVDTAKDALKAEERAVLALQKKLSNAVRVRDGAFANWAKMQPSLANVVRDIPLLDFIDPKYKIAQRVIEDIRLDYYFATVPIVDRCETCHQGITDAYWNEEYQPYTTHPRLDLFLGGKSPHPVEDFGCTVCHRGRPPATEFVFATHTPDNHDEHHAWEQKYDYKHDHWWNRPMLPSKYTQASCLQCHGDAWELPGAEKLMRGKRLFRDFGCFGCHKTTDMLDVTGGGELPRRGPSLKMIQSKTTPDWAYDWIFDPKHFRPTTRMPRFFGQTNNPRESDRAREQVEVQAIVAYLWKHSADAAYTRGPEGAAARGRELVESVGCTGCHKIADAATPEGLRGYTGERVAGTSERNHGPELSRIGGKTNHAWLENWLRNPQHYSPGTRMPNLRLSAQEAADVAAYLMTQGADWTSPAAPAVDESVVRDILLTVYEEKQRHSFAVNQVDAMSAEARLLEVGRLSIRRYGCAGCHDIGGFESEAKIGVDLFEEGSKPLDKFDFGLIGHGHGYKEIDPTQTDHGVALPAMVDHTMHEWFERKLLNPRVYDWGKEKAVKDRLRMPNFEMNRDEAEALVTFLLGMVKDPMPVARKAGSINGDPVHDASAKRYSAEQRGWKFLKEFNCAGCHRLEDATLTFWLKGVDQDGKHTGDPQEVTLRGRRGEMETDEDTGQQTLRFQLGAYHEALPEKAPSQNWVVDSKDIIRQRDHIGDGLAERFLAYLNEGQKKARKPAYADVSDIKSQLPPPLIGEGHKIQGPWVFNFLKEVEVLRPWLKLRMPSFTMTDAEAKAIAGYFGSKAWGQEKPRLDTVAADLKKKITAAKRAGETEVVAALEQLKTALGIDRALYANPFPFEKYEERTAAYLAAKNAQYPNYLERSLAIMRDPGVDCFKCHIVRGRKPSDPDPANWAPELGRVRDRLRPQWVVKWLRNPQHVLPGTKMPTFQWDKMKVGPGELGDGETKIQAVKDALFNLDRFTNSQLRK